MSIDLIALTAFIAGWLLAAHFRPGGREKTHEPGMIADEQSKFQTVVDHATDGILVVRIRDRRFVLANPAICAMLGYTTEELLARCIDDLHAPEDLPAIRAHFEAHAQGGTERLSCLPFVRKDGSQFFGDLSAGLFDVDGEPCVIGFIRDVSDRLRVEEALRDSEMRWQFALEGAGAGVWDWNPQTDRVFYSKRWKSMLGYSDDEVGDSIDEWRSRVHPDDLEGCRQMLDRLFAGEEPIYRCEHRVRCKDGSYRWILDQGSLVARTPDGKPLRVVGTHTDVTDRHVFERALRHERDLNQRYLDTVQTLVVALDAEGRITMVNRRAREVLGYAEDELIGCDWFDTCVPLGEAERSRPIFSLLLAGKLSGSEYWEHAILCRDGRQLQIAWHNAYLTDAQGEICGVLSSGMDISGRKAVEQALRTANEHLELALQGANLGTYDINLQSGELSVNDRYLSILGYDHGSCELSVHFWFEQIHPDDRARVGKAMEEVDGGLRDDFDEEYRLRHQSGSWVWVLDRGRVFGRGADGKAARAAGTLFDITERKRIEKEWRDSEERFRLFLNLNPILAWLLDAAGRYIYVNETYQTHFGLSRSNWFGRSVADVWPKGVAAELIEWDRSVLARGQVQDRVEKIQNADGSVQYWMTFRFPIQSTDGDRFVGGVGIDITDRIRVEQANERLTAALHDANLRLQDDIEAERTRIAHGLHDELGQNLAALRHYLDRLNSGLDGDAVRLAQYEKIQAAFDATHDAMRRIIADLRPVLLDQVGFAMAITMLSRQFEETHGIAVDLQLDGAVEGVPDRVAIALYRFLQEALTNVAKHAEAAEVRIRFSRFEERIELSVADDGIGFDDSRPSYGLLGMQERARRLGGQVVIGGLAETGTEIVMSLPSDVPPASGAT